MIIDLVSSYERVAKFQFEKNNDDGFVEKLSRKFSAIMMFVFATVISAIQLVGRPITCWCHNEYSGTKCRYATTYCYITSSYVPVGNSTTLPRREDLQSHRILYYQWVPFIFLFQAFLFFAPSLIWRFLNSRAGYDINSYIEHLKKDESDSVNNPVINFVTSHIRTCLDFKNAYVHRGRAKALFLRSFYDNGYFLTISFLLVKIIYFVVAFLQLLLMNYWFSDAHHSKSTSLIRLLFGGHNWQLSERFPSMTLCKFQVYILTDQQTHWVQCTLPINIYIEKIYLIIWIWLWVLLVALFVSFVNHVRFVARAERFLGDELRAQAEQFEHNGTMADITQNDVERFRNYLRLDGVLLIKLIKANTTRFYTMNILKNLFECMKQNDKRN